MRFCGDSERVFSGRSENNGHITRMYMCHRERMDPNIGVDGVWPLCESEGKKKTRHKSENGLMESRQQEKKG